MRKKQVVISMVAVLLMSACGISSPQSIPSPIQSTATQSVETLLTPQPRATTTFTPASSTKARNMPDLMACDPPYLPNSIWNMPIDWSKARIHPKSESMVEAFLAGRGFISSNVESYAPPIYYATNETPLVPVKLQKNRFRDVVDDRGIEYSQPGATVMMPIPEGALPSPGSDGQLAIVNLDTGEEWGLREGRMDNNGHWIASGAYRYHIVSSGIPPRGFGQRGAGIGQLAGIIRPCEIMRGRIGHAVTLGYDYPCSAQSCAAQDWPKVIPPFTTTDGKGTHPFDIPMGARLVIQPDIPFEQIVQACRGLVGCVIWVVNMQEYGGFIVDRSGGAKTYGEGNLSANWSSLMWQGQMLRNIPHSWYAVLDWDYPATSDSTEP